MLLGIVIEHFSHSNSVRIRFAFNSCDVNLFAIKINTASNWRDIVFVLSALATALITTVLSKPF